MPAPVAQLAFNFNPAPVAPVTTWTPERARHYSPGHPWAHPEAYPDLEGARAQGAARGAKHLAEPESNSNRHLPYNWPKGHTPKSKVRRLEQAACLIAGLEKDEAMYLDYRARAQLDPNGRACTYSVNREALALKFNHVLYGRGILLAIATLYPEALPQ